MAIAVALTNPLVKVPEIAVIVPELIV